MDHDKDVRIENLEKMLFKIMASGTEIGTKQKSIEQTHENQQGLIYAALSLSAILIFRLVDANILTAEDISKDIVAKLDDDATKIYPPSYKATLKAVARALSLPRSLP